MGPEDRVVPGPEVVGEGVEVGAHHGLDARVDDGEGVVGPEVAPDVGEVLVFEEELVTEAAVEHELGLRAIRTRYRGVEEEEEEREGS